MCQLKHEIFWETFNIARIHVFNAFVAARLVNAPTAAQGRRQFGDVEVEPCAFRMEARFIRRNFTERARRLISRNAGIAARVFAQTASAP